MKKFIIIQLFVLAFLNISCEKSLSTSPDDVQKPNLKLFIESEPEGAKIYLDNKNTGQLTPDTIEWLDSRNYKLTLKLDHFKDTNVVVTVNQSEVTKVRLDYTRNPNMRGSLYCDSNPRDAEVFIGDSSTGKFTPVAIHNLFPGLYTIKFKKEGYWIDSTTSYVESAKTRYATLSLKDSLVWVNFTSQRINLPTDYLTHVTIESGWIKWISTLSEGVIRFDDKTVINYNETNSPLPGNNVNMIGIDASGKKWICTSSGLAVLDGQNWTIFTSSNSQLPSNLVECVAFDVDGAAWIGTANAGVAKLEGTSWTLYNTSNSGLASNGIRSITIDPTGVKWIGTSNAGVSKFDNSVWKTFNKDNTKPIQEPPPAPPKPGIPNNNIECVALDVSGITWVAVGEEGDVPGGSATYKGFGDWTIFALLPSSSVNTIVIDPGNNKWFANSIGGISKYTGPGLTPTDGSWIHYNTSNSGIGNDRVFSIAIDANDHKWIATYGGGLVKYKGN
ncbi:MAG: PEGA domain-containing protein [Ignavibacteriales bacterium]|nr:MAG: PEGA domain-containing protein [Ignavibacteriales bacterium]